MFFKLKYLIDIGTLIINTKSHQYSLNQLSVLSLFSLLLVT